MGLGLEEQLARPRDHAVGEVVSPVHEAHDARVAGAVLRRLLVRVRVGVRARVRVSFRIRVRVRVSVRVRVRVRVS